MKKLRNETIINCIFIALGIAVLLMIPSQVPQLYTQTEKGIGPTFFPTLAADIVIAVNLISLLKNIKKIRLQAHSETAEEKNTPFSRDELRVLLTLLIIAAYIFLMPIVGYIISSLVVSNLMLVILNARKWYYFAAISAFTLIIYYVFANVLYVSLP